MSSPTQGTIRFFIVIVFLIYIITELQHINSKLDATSNSINSLNETSEIGVLKSE